MPASTTSKPISCGWIRWAGSTTAAAVTITSPSMARFSIAASEGGQHSTMLSAGDTVELTIEKPAAGGHRVARLDGQVVLVAGAIPGELAQPRKQRAAIGDEVARTDP